MVGTKSRGYSNSGQLSEGEYSMPFLCTHHSPNFDSDPDQFQNVMALKINQDRRGGSSSM